MINPQFWWLKADLDIRFQATFWNKYLVEGTAQHRGSDGFSHPPDPGLILNIPKNEFSLQIIGVVKIDWQLCL